MKLGMSHYGHKSIPDAKFEAGSSSSSAWRYDVTNFPSEEGNESSDSAIYVQSIPSLTTPRAIFLMGEFPTPGQTEVQNPDARAYKNELNPTPGAFSSIIHYKNMKKEDRNHVKLQDFIIFR